jgi:hypothetical protein
MIEYRIKKIKKKGLKIAEKMGRDEGSSADERKEDLKDYSEDGYHVIHIG